MFSAGSSVSTLYPSIAINENQMEKKKHSIIILFQNSKVAKTMVKQREMKKVMRKDSILIVSSISP